MGKSERISGLFWFVVSIVVMAASYRLGLGSLRRPGPGFFYFYIGLFMGIMALIVLVWAWTSKQETSRPPLFRGRNILKIFLVLVSVFLYAVLMETLGFVAVTFLLFLFLIGFMERKGPVFSTFVSLIVTAAAYGIFKVLLQSQLPSGWMRF